MEGTNELARMTLHEILKKLIKFVLDFQNLPVIVSLLKTSLRIGYFGYYLLHLNVRFNLAAR